MKKEKNKNIILDYACSIFMALIYFIAGCLLIMIRSVNILEPFNYASSFFFVFAFFLLIIYFVKKGEKDYENLFLAISNVIAGAFFISYKEIMQPSTLLGIDTLIFVVLVSLSKFLSGKKLLKESDLAAFPKFAIAIVILIFGFLVADIFFSQHLYQGLVFGFLFIVLGILSLLEIIIILTIKNTKIEIKLTAIVNNVKPVKKEKTKTIKEVEKVKPKKEIVKKIKIEKPTPKKITTKKTNTKTEKK